MLSLTLAGTPSSQRATGAVWATVCATSSQPAAAQLPWPTETGTLAHLCMRTMRTSWPVQPKSLSFRVLLCAVRTLNVAGQSRVTLSLR